MPSAQKFWMVLPDASNAPAQRYASKSAAIGAAEKFAMLFPGETVFVLEPVAARVGAPRTVHTVDLRPHVDDINHCGEECP
ncbi:hypothetical protein [Breoghania sp.]|uniref:hypothetical protein n=1 Tax=Breoghania sp. TaxID=2065378 RepID=UPI002AABDD2D|nr:hypothetical protein [Breoghania sp.]